MSEACKVGSNQVTFKCKPPTQKHKWWWKVSVCYRPVTMVTEDEFIHYHKLLLECWPETATAKYSPGLSFEHTSSIILSIKGFLLLLYIFDYFLHSPGIFLCFSCSIVFFLSTITFPCVPPPLCILFLCPSACCVIVRSEPFKHGGELGVAYSCYLCMSYTENKSAAFFKLSLFKQKVKFYYLNTSKCSHCHR